MRLFITALVCLISVSFFSQEETRLALVIGNANYSEGELNNPVNDAMLVASTLESLDFEVILATNLTDKRSFIKSIRQFGDRRDDYDVGLVYYAGHGVQAGGVNYLLPTKEIYETEEDIYYNGVAVHDIMKYLTAQSGSVNILVLDACRNNPFEHKWNPQRSLEGGRGLAKIPPPSGSLIAFSTDAGETAADGTGANSVYCESLCINMQREDTPIEQMFKYVRAEVEEATNGRQSPVEVQKLIGEEFYLVKSNFEEEYKIINRLIEEGKLEKALALCSELVTKTKSFRALNTRSGIFIKLYNYDDALDDINAALRINPNNSSSYYILSNIKAKQEKYHEALSLIDRAIEIDSSDFKYYNNQGIILFRINKYDLALKSYDHSINLFASSNAYLNKAILFYDLGNTKDAESCLKQAERLDPTNYLIFNFKARAFAENGDFNNAIQAYSRSLDIITMPETLTALAEIYLETEQVQKALDNISKAIMIQGDYCYSCMYAVRGRIYHDMGKYEDALESYHVAIEGSDIQDMSTIANIVNIYVDQRKYRKAIKFLAEKITKTNNELHKTYLFAYLYSAKGRMFKSLDYVNDLVELEEHGVTGNELAADIYSSFGSYERAIEHLDDAIDNLPFNTGTEVDLHRLQLAKAEMYLENNEDSEAIKMFEAAILSNPRDAYPYASIAEIKLTEFSSFFNIKNEEDWVTQIKEVLELIKDFENCVNNINPSSRTSYDYYEVSLLYTYLYDLDIRHLESTFGAVLNTSDLEYRILSNITVAIEKFSIAIHSENKQVLIDSYSKERLLNSYLIRASLYSYLNEDILMCEDYEKACELGDCDAYNKYCH